MIEVQPDAILASRDLRRVGSTLDDRRDADGVAREHFPARPRARRGRRREVRRRPRAARRWRSCAPPLPTVRWNRCAAPSHARTAKGTSRARTSPRRAIVRRASVLSSRGEMCRAKRSRAGRAGARRSALCRVAHPVRCVLQRLARGLERILWRFHRGSPALQHQQTSHELDRTDNQRARPVVGRARRLSRRRAQW